MALDIGSNAVFAARTVLDVSSSGEIQLSYVDASRREGEKWLDDPTKKKQVVTWLDDGGAITMEGLVPESVAIRGSAKSARLLVSLSVKDLPAFAAGRVSRSLVAMQLVGVVELRDDKGKVVYTSDKLTSSRVQAPAAAEMDSGGRIIKA